MKPTPALLIALIMLANLAGPVPLLRAQTPATAARCRTDSVQVKAAGAVQSRALPYFVEVQLTITNKTQETMRVDPGRFVLRPDRGDPVRPASAGDVVYALRAPASPSVGAFGIFVFGSVGVGVGVGPIDLSARAIEARMLRAGDLVSGATVRGSVYYRPAAWPGEFTVTLDGLTASSGAGPAPVELRGCQMPFRPSQPPVVYAVPPGARTFDLDARGVAGPIALSVSGAEFTRQATTLTVAVDNSASAEASLFVAIGDAQLVDHAGKVYTVRMLRSDLPDRAAGHGQIRGRLVFEPMPVPPQVTSAVLRLPGVQVLDSKYDLTVDLRF
jgi:hypothetical protein